MIGWVLLGCSLLCLVIALHPFITYPVSLRVLRYFHRQPVQGGTAPRSVAICVCAYNEQDVIEARVENLLDMRRSIPGLDILVYVDAASDGTAAILSPYASQIQLFVSGERHGKTYGMNHLVSHTDADIVVFTDANVVFAHDAMIRLLQPFADQTVGCACGHLRYALTGKAASAGGSPTAEAGSLYWRLEEHIKSLESETGSVMGADGAIFAIRRSLHRPPPPSLIDDMYLSLSILCRGYRVVRVADAIAWEPAASDTGEEFQRKIRIACQAFNVNRVLWPELIRLPLIDIYKYVSHKLIRWLVVYFIAISLANFLAAIWVLEGSLVALLVLLAVATAGGIVCSGLSRLLAQVREIMAAFLATGLGVWSSCRGMKFQTWTPPLSARAELAKEGSVLLRDAH